MCALCFSAECLIFSSSCAVAVFLYLVRAVVMAVVVHTGDLGQTLPVCLSKWSFGTNNPVSLTTVLQCIDKNSVLLLYAFKPLNFVKTTCFCYVSPAFVSQLFVIDFPLCPFNW